VVVVTTTLTLVLSSSLMPAPSLLSPSMPLFASPSHSPLRSLSPALLVLALALAFTPSLLDHVRWPLTVCVGSPSCVLALFRTGLPSFMWAGCVLRSCIPIHAHGDHPIAPSGCTCCNHNQFWDFYLPCVLYY